MEMSPLTRIKIFATFILICLFSICIITTINDRFVQKDVIVNEVPITNVIVSNIPNQHIVTPTPNNVLEIQDKPIDIIRKSTVTPTITITPTPIITATSRPGVVLLNDELDYNKFPKSTDSVHGDLVLGDYEYLSVNPNYQYTIKPRDYYFVGDKPLIRFELVNIKDININKITYYLTFKNLDTGFIIYNHEKVYTESINLNNLDKYVLQYKLTVPNLPKGDYEIILDIKANDNLNGCKIKADFSII
jgi:hypothetical protein